MKRKQKLLLTEALALANAAQVDYEKLDAPRTQNVRNPLPMHTLIESVLPRLPAPDDLIKGEARVKVTVLGRQILTYVPVNLPARDILGDDYLETEGMTIDDIVYFLRKEGYIAKRTTVAMTLVHHAYRNKFSSGTSKNHLCNGCCARYYFVRSS